MHRFVYATYMLMVASTGVTFVFLEDFEAQFGVPAWGIGLIAALGYITAVIAAVVISPFGDRGHLRTLAACAFTATIVGNIAFGFADGLLTLAVSRALTGLGVGIFSIVGRKALIGEVTDDSAEKIGMFISAAVAGFVSGPVIGSVFSSFGGISTPFFVVAGLLTLMAVPTMYWLSSVPIAVSEKASASTMWSLLAEPGIRAAVAAQVAVFFNIGVFNATVDKYLTDLGLTTTGVGVVILIVGMPLLVIPRLAGRYIDSLERPADLLLTGLAIFVPVVLIIGLWEGVVVFATFAIVQTCLESTLFPAATRVVVNETGAARSATGTGLLDASGSSAAALSALAAPSAYELADGPLGSFGMSGVFSIVMLVLARSGIRRRDQLRQGTMA